MKTAFVPEVKKKKEIFFQQLANYIKSKEKKVKPGTIEVYNDMVGTEKRNLWAQSEYHW